VYTHLHPELDEVPTARSVLRDGRIAMYRALNIGRLVVVTGSGSTATLGQPAWTELPYLYGLSVQTQINESFQNHPSLNPVQFEEAENDPEYRRLMFAYRTDLRQKIDEILRQIHALSNGNDAEPVKHDEFFECIPDAQGNRPDDKTFWVPLLKIPANCEQDPLTLFSLCDALLKRLPDDRETGETRLYRARHEFASKFCASEVDVIVSKLKRGADLNTGAFSVDQAQFDAFSNNQEKASENSALGSYLGVLSWLYSSSNNITVSKELSGVDLQTIVKNHVDHHDGFGPKLQYNRVQGDKTARGVPSRDIVSTLLNELRVSRIATLNYDVEVERRILRDLRLSGESEATDFEDLCEQTRTSRPHKKRLLIESGVKKGAVSITLNSDNIGEIVNFSSYSRRFEKQVLHLHGRFDDPDNLVLTPEDYLRTYAQREISRDSFREAQQTLFEGNDVLFVGIGFKEEDVRRPLARFFASETYVRHDSRRAFLLKAASSCKKCFKRSGACSDCERTDEAFVLGEYQKLNVYTLLFGGQNYRMTRSWLESSLEAIKKAIKDQNEKFAFWEASLDDRFHARTGETTRKSQLGKNGAWGPFAKSAMLGEADDKKNCLLTSAELCLLSEMSRQEPSKAQLPILKMIFEELSSRVMARAANLELKQLKNESGLWWDAWGEIPVERRALYHLASSDVAGKSQYLWARHCPVATGTENIKLKDWAPLRAAKESAKEQIQKQQIQDAIEVSNKIRRLPRQRRILRFSGPRGVGKGTLIRLLMRREIHSALFEKGEDDYFGAFVAHLSFSMEFASVAKALTRFFARHVAEMQCEHDSAAKDGMRETRAEITGLHKQNIPEGALRLRFANLLQEFTPKERLELGVILERFEVAMSKALRLGPNATLDLTEEDLKELTRRLFIARREAEPRLVAKPEIASIDGLDPMVERDHRLDMLRDMMFRYGELARQHGGKRLFVCLGGLDKLCDQNGDAHNPMHRALFRILTGTHGNEEVDPPMDLLLLAGNPQTPICFLSNVCEDIDAVPLHERKRFATYSKTGQALEIWPKLERPDWSDRLDMVPKFAGAQVGRGGKPSRLNDKDSKKEFLGWAESQDAASLYPRQHEHDRADGIHRTLWNSVNLTMLVYACWREIRDKNLEKGNRPDFESFVRELERCENRDGAVGIMNFVFSTYGLLNRSIASPDDKLDDLILRHLVLFGLPVEPLVLLACPMIHRRLLRQYSEENKSAFADSVSETGGDPRETNHKRDYEDWKLRGWMLNKLRLALEGLCRRSLVLEVHCAFHEPENGAPQKEMFLHRRFGIHGQIREMVGHRMQLDVSDAGDINHHQISLFCSQPQDLPTPSHAHFRMLREILDKLQEDNRKSLNIAYRHSQAGIKYRRREWDIRRSDADDNVLIFTEN